MNRLYRGRRKSLAVCAVLVAALVPKAWSAPPTAAQRTQVRLAEMALTKAGNLFRAKKFAEANQAVKEAQASLQKLADDDSREIAALVAPVQKRLDKAREMLEAEGVSPPAGKSASKGGSPGKKANSVSFTKQVAPILLANCGGCHVQRSRGQFSMATFAALSKGSPGGVVIMPGDAKGSRLIELIESGDMPRGGGQVSSDDLATLVAWINAGARFDGDNPSASLASLSPGAAMSDKPSMLRVVPAGEKDEVQFARDVGPLLLESCIECHGDQNPRNNFNLNTFAGLLRGGDSGAVLVPGKPEESLLIKKLKGTAAGARMPQGRDPLSDEQTAKIEKWIALGARFDGPDPAMSLENTVAQTAARRLTHEELSRDRAALALKHWQLILPDTKPNQEETASVLVVGGVGPAILSQVAHTADDQVAKLRKQFKLPSEQPLIKGRLTLFVFDKRFDYGEIGTMLERREIPGSWQGHWSYNALDAYGCVLLSEGEASAGLVAQQIAGAYLASLGQLPRWFSEGSARAIAAKIDPKDPRVKRWDEAVPRILTSTDKPNGFMTGNLAPEDSDVLSYSFARHLMNAAPRYGVLVAGLQQGEKFDTAFAKAYGGSPYDQVAAWAARASKRSR